jgi:hypothetical protein
MFPNHVVLEVQVTNTLQGVTLENVEVQLSGLAPNWAEIGASTIPKLVFEQKASSYSVLQKNTQNEAGVLTGAFGAGLRFLMKEDGDDLGNDDDYPIEKVKITTGDFNNPRALPQGQFRSLWEEMGKQGAESTQKLLLPYKSIDSAVENIILALNMQACDGTSKVEAGARQHILCLCGTFSGGSLCLVKAMIGMDQTHGCVGKVSARCKSQAVADTMSKALM